MNMTYFEQHVVIKFLSKRNKTNVEIENELFAVREDTAYKKLTVRTKRCREGRKSLQENDRVGKAVTVIPHPLYSPDLSLRDFFFTFAFQADNEREMVPDNRRNLRQKENYAKLHPPIFNVVTHSGWNIRDTASMRQCRWRLFQR